MKSFELPAVYPITNEKLSGLSHRRQVEEFAAGGALFVQLREKDAAPNQFYESAVEAVAAARALGVKIIVNDRVDIALAARADGVHLGQDDLPIAEARRILGENAIIGFSTHNLAQAVAAIGLPLDYIAVGPVFATDTKANPEAVVGLENLKLIRRAIERAPSRLPLVAIGGIKKENARRVIEAGADSVAVIGALFEGGTIRENVETLIRAATI